MAKAGFLFCIVCAVAAFGSGLPGGGVVGDGAGAVIRAAQGEIGVRETGPNAGKRVDGYNRYVGVRNAPWCASFVSWCFGQAGYREPRTAWSPALFPAQRQVEIASLKACNDGKGLVYGIWFPELKRIGHCGIVERMQGDFVIGIEGNTNLNGGREGVAVMRKIRHRRTITKYSDWL